MSDDVPQLTDWQLMRLRDCAGSNRIGMLDRGFPQLMKGLAALGLVDVSAIGAKVTMVGLKLLADPDVRGRLLALGGTR